MNRMHMLAIGALLTLACGTGGLLSAADAPATTTAPAVDAAMQKKADAKVEKLVSPMKLTDEAKLGRVKAILSDWCITMWTWHAQHDPELDELWKQWNAARAVVPKDEYPGEIIAYKIEAVYASLKPAYAAFIEKLSVELTPEQIDAFKEAWSRSPGMMRTYNAYLETVPDLKDDQKKVIFARMQMAREAAMLTDASKEIISIFKRHKVKVEQYVGGLEWTKLLNAFANKGKAPATAKAPASAPAAAPAAE